MNPHPLPLPVAFLGTPEIAAEMLRSLWSNPHYKIKGLISKPDSPVGRNLVLSPSPVKAFVLKQPLSPPPILTPLSLRRELPELESEIRSWEALVGIVVAYGQILPEAFINLFPCGCVNLHTSLLPRWRGAAPIQRSLEKGETQTGITLQKIGPALDEGDIIGVRKLDIQPDDTSLSIYKKLTELGKELLQKELMDYLQGKIKPQPQINLDPQAPHYPYAKKIEKAEGELSWNLSAHEIHNKIRAFVLGPGTWTTFRGERLKIHRTNPLQKQPPLERGSQGPPTHQRPGTLFPDSKEGRLWIQTGNQEVLEILEVQMASRKRMSTKDFLTGYQVNEGEILGSSSPNSDLDLSPVLKEPAQEKKPR